VTITATGGFKAAKPSVAISLRGDIAEVWSEGERIGLLYQWSVHGQAGKWTGDALKYRIEKQSVGEVELRLFLRSPGGSIELIAYGQIADETVVDGELHKKAVRIKGTRLEVA